MTRKLSIIFCFSFITISMNSCLQDGYVPISPDTLIISLDKSNYTKDELATISIQNNSSETLILYNCAFNPGYDVEKLDNDTWFKPYGLICPGIGVPFNIKPFTLFSRQFHPAIYTDSLGSINGTYRLKLWLLESDKNSTREYLADSLRVTKPFSIESY